MTWDPETNTSMYTEPQLTTPMVSPPMSPKLDGAALPPGTRALRSAGNSGGLRWQRARACGCNEGGRGQDFESCSNLYARPAVPCAADVPCAH